MASHFFMPDTQVRPGVPTNHLIAAANYIIDKKPDVIIHGGDHWDFPSLSSYEKKGSAFFEDASLAEDIQAGNDAMELFDGVLAAHNDRQRRYKKRIYTPRKVFLMGNHENRMQRLIDSDPVLYRGVIGYHQLSLDGWEVIPFLEMEKIDGVQYSHYFYNPNTGRPYGGVMSTRIKNVGFSFTMGHQQGKDMAERRLADGTTVRGLVAGSFYQHDEDYRGPQGNVAHWRGCIYKTEVADGDYCMMELSLDYLMRRWL
jgi:hypothetical protein